MSRPGYALGVVRPQTLIMNLTGAALEAFVDAQNWKCKLPQRGRVIGIDLNVAAVGGTHSTSTLDVLAGASSLLAAVFDVAGLTPGTPVVKEGSALTAAAAEIAKDTTINVTLAESSGTTPTWTRATLQIDYVPLGD